MVFLKGIHAHGYTFFLSAPRGLPKLSVYVCAVTRLEKNDRSSEILGFIFRFSNF